MRDYAFVSNIMERIIYKYMETEQLSRHYGTDMDISQVEIHTIEAIGSNPGINVTSLAKMRHKSKGAISQMIRKLIDKGLVEKHLSEKSEAEVVLSLTELGMKAYNGHKEYHLMADDTVFTKLKEMPEQSYADLIEVLSAFENYLDKRV